MILLDRFRGTLAPTASYERREWHWWPADPLDTDRDGTLTILLTHTGKRITRTEVFVYAVQIEWEAAADLGLRSFLLENLHQPDEYGPFRCVVGGMYETCGCEAGWFDKRRTSPTGCKHRAALADLCAKGVV